MFYALFFILLLFSQNTVAQDESIWLPPEKDFLLEIMDHAYNLEFDQFGEKLEQYRQKYPERPEAMFAPVVAWWIKVTSDIYNPKFDDVFISAIDSVIDKLEMFEEKDPLYPVADFYIFSAMGFKGIMHVTRGNWFSAALDGRIAVQGVEQSLKGDIPNPDAKFGTGLYLYYADIIPERYPILKPLFYFYPEGDKKQGLRDLQETTINGVFAKVVASYMYSVILFTREKNYLKAYQIMTHLSESYPQNPTFLMLRAGIATRINHFSRALKLLAIFEQRVTENVPYYPVTKLRLLNYRYGEIYYKMREYEKALGYLNKAIEPMEGVLEEKYLRYKVYALLTSGYCYKNLGQLEKAKIRFEAVLNMEEKGDSHTKAENELSNIRALEKLNQIN